MPALPGKVKGGKSSFIKANMRDEDSNGNIRKRIGRLNEILE